MRHSLIIVGSDYRLQHRATSDYESNYNDVTASTALSEERAQIHSITKRDKRAQIHTIPYFPTVIPFHVNHATQHLHQNCLCTLTSSYRRLANNYTLLLNASTTYTTCRPGVESSYTSICLSFGNSLYVIQRCLNIYRYPRIY